MGFSRPSPPPAQPIQPLVPPVPVVIEPEVDMKQDIEKDQRDKKKVGASVPVSQRRGGTKTILTSTFGQPGQAQTTGKTLLGA